jgi:hypothetical protein
MFFRGSRYADVGEDEIIDGRGRVIRFKKIRLITTPPGQMVHTVNQGERLDHLAHRYFRNPERFWRILDANQALWPDDLVSEVGRKILIPPFEG